VSLLLDHSIPKADLIGVREIARAYHGGMLTLAEARVALERRYPHLAGCFGDVATAAAVIDLIEALLQARSPVAARLSRSERLKLKALECLQLADNANHTRTREIYKSLAVAYEQMAIQAETIEKQRLNMFARRTGVGARQPPRDLS